MTAKDDRNLQQVLERIESMDQPRRAVMQRLHELITITAPALKPRIWYGMPGYAASASTPVLVFIRNDERMVLGLSEKATLVPEGGDAGRLMPSAWFVDELDEVTERRIEGIVRAATAAV